MIIKRLLVTLSSNVKVAFTNCNTNKELFFSYTKDKTPLGKNSGVVYSIPCSACLATYVGETCQNLEVRLSTHKSDVLKRNDHTALAVHASISRRNSGKSYKSKSGKVVPMRKMGDACSEKCRYKCSTHISEDLRKVLFEVYWELASLQRQRDYLYGCVKYQIPPFRRTEKTVFEC